MSLSYSLFCFNFHLCLLTGLTMFYNLPRIMFGQVQSRLFPMYFATTLLLSSITLITYTMGNPYETWTRPDWKLVCI